MKIVRIVAIAALAAGVSTAAQADEPSLGGFSFKFSGGYLDGWAKSDGRWSVSKSDAGGTVKAKTPYHYGKEAKASLSSSTDTVTYKGWQDGLHIKGSSGFGSVEVTAKNGGKAHGFTTTGSMAGIGYGHGSMYNTGATFKGRGSGIE